MKVLVKLFAGARESVGAASIPLDLPDGCTVADLRAALIRGLPAVAALVGRSRIAVDLAFADDDSIVPEGAELALIPPVSGGST